MKLFKQPTHKKLSTVAWSCAAAALLVLIGVALAEGRAPLSHTTAKTLPGDEQKPWAMELP